jgi:hypothetical protein
MDEEEATPNHVVPDSAVTDKGVSVGDTDLPVATAGLLSLGDIEAMLGNASARPTNNDAPSRVSHDKEDTEHGGADDGWDEGTASVRVSPWTLCQKWDACAIGTMPGYPA